MFDVQNVQDNGTLYIHVYFVKAGNSPNPADDNYERRFTVYRSRSKYCCIIVRLSPRRS